MANRKTAKKKARLERQRQQEMQHHYGQSILIGLKPMESRQNADNKPTICKKAEEKPWNLDDEIDKAFERRLGK